MRLNSVIAQRARTVHVYNGSFGAKTWTAPFDLCIVAFWLWISGGSNTAGPDLTAAILSLSNSFTNPVDGASEDVLAILTLTSMSAIGCAANQIASPCSRSLEAGQSVTLYNKTWSSGTMSSGAGLVFVPL